MTDTNNMKPGHYIHTKGEKYEVTRQLGLKELLALIRSRLKKAARTGSDAALPQGTQLSIKMPHHGSYKVQITSVPEGFAIFTEEYLLAKAEGDHTTVFTRDRIYTEEARALKKYLQRVFSEYQKAESDPHTDYYNSRFYLDVTFAWELTKAQEAEGIARHKEALQSIPAPVEPEEAEEEVIELPSRAAETQPIPMIVYIYDGKTHGTRPDWHEDYEERHAIEFQGQVFIGELTEAHLERVQRNEKIDRLVDMVRQELKGEDLSTFVSRLTAL